MFSRVVEISSPTSFVPFFTVTFAATFFVCNRSGQFCYSLPQRAMPAHACISDEAYDDVVEVLNCRLAQKMKVFKVVNIFFNLLE